MKHSAYQQFATIHEDSASLFDARLNAKVYELRAFNPKVVFSERIPLYAHIIYTVTEDVPENIAEASAVEGVSFVCGMCPYFKAPRKDDGTADKRCKYGDCEHTELGRTLKMAPACEKLYEPIKEGDVKICFMD